MKDRIFRRTWSPALLALPLLAALVLPSRADAQVLFSPAPGSAFEVLDGPNSIAIGDLNRDERPDLATATSLSFADRVTVLLADGAGGFAEAPASPFRVGRRPLSVAIGDLNGDEMPDLVTANDDSGDVTVLLGDGAGDFAEAPGSPFRVGEGASSVAIGDLNGDEMPDLATANDNPRGGNVSVLLGDGAGGFARAAGSPFGAGSGPRSVAIGDLNGDDRPDLAAANSGSGDVTVLLGDGAGDFAEAPGSPFGVGAGPRSVAIGDLNGDEMPDLATANIASDDVSVLLGDGAGDFAEAAGSPFAVGGDPIGVAIGDLNGDGGSDLATSNFTSGDVSVLLGDDAGGFAEAAESPFPVLGDGPFAVAIGDLNGDGRLDLATPNFASHDVSVLLGIVCTITGTPEDDILPGTPGRDVICGREGSDLLLGRGGDDIVIGEQGDDRLLGRGGDDVLDGGEGEDDLVGHVGDDFLVGGPGTDRVAYSNHATGGIDLDLGTGLVTSANLGTDTIAHDGFRSTVEDAAGTPFDDTLRGANGDRERQDNVFNGAGGDDTLTGGSGNDLLRGKNDEDELHGQGDLDVLKPGAGDDLVTGGGSRDTVRYDDIRGGGVMVDLAATIHFGMGTWSGTASPLGGSNSGTDTLVRIYNASGTRAGDQLRAVIAEEPCGGFSCPLVRSLLRGGGGDDSLDTGDGDGVDTVDGGAGADSCVADAGDARFSCP